MNPLIYKTIFLFALYLSKNQKVKIKNITLKEDKNGYRTMNIEIDKNIKTVKVTITHSGSKGTHSLVLDIPFHLQNFTVTHADVIRPVQFFQMFQQFLVGADVPVGGQGIF